MALRNPPLVKVASSTNGNGTYTYTETPQAGYRTFTDALADGDFVNGDTCYLFVIDTGALGSARLFEWGLYTVNTTAKTIARTDIKQSSDGVATAASWGAGTRDIYTVTIAQVLAYLAVANKFTADQEIEKVTPRMLLDALSGDASVDLQASGTNRARFIYSSSFSALVLDYLSSGGAVQSRLIMGNGTLEYGAGEIAPGGGSKIDRFPSGTVMLFFQAAVPTGWTLVTTQNDKALRIVSGTGGGSGGSRALSAATVGGTTLTEAQIPSHTHPIDAVSGTGGTTSGLVGTDVANFLSNAFAVTDPTGGGTSHDHALALAYIDVIAGSKN